MKSGLRDRNNLLAEQETVISAMQVSMKSGLRDRNNERTVNREVWELTLLSQ